MKNKLMKMTALLVICGLALSGPLAYAEMGDEGEGGTGYKKAGKHGEFFKDLNLTPEQKEKLKAQREAKKESSKALHEQLKTKMQALHETISKPETTRADVNGLLTEINTLKGQLFAQHIDGVFEMKQILTAEQFAKMQAKQKERMAQKRDGWMKKHREGKEKVSTEQAPS